MVTPDPSLPSTGTGSAARDSRLIGWLIGIGLIVMGGALLFSGRIIESRQD